MIEGTVMQDFDTFDEPYVSIKSASRADQVKLYNVMNSQADAKLNDMVGQKISVKDVVVMKRGQIDKSTGEIDSYIRIILVDKNGKTYSTGSIGIFRALKQAFAMFGEPTWDEPVTFEIAQAKTRGGNNMLTLKAV